MSWEVVKLNDIADIYSGFAFKSSDMSVQNGIPLIKIKNISDFLVSQQCETYLNPDIITAKYDRFILQDDDFLIAMTGQGSVGRIGKMSKVDRLYYVNQRVAIVRVNPKCAFPAFVFYQIATAQNETFLFNKANGAGQPNLSATQIGELPVILPSKDKQVQIADILGKFNHLIENNQKQIKLLEEAAQRLYKEWFVDLRFPGYEDVAVVDGVPEGWKKGMLSDVAVFKRGSTITKSQVNEGNVPVVAGGLEPAYYHNQANTVSPVVTVSGSGANAGFTRLYTVDVFASDCSFTDAKDSPYVYFVYCFLKANKAELDVLQKGAAQPHVYAKDINAMELNVPNEQCIKEYCERISPFFDKIKTLDKQIKYSIEARDRLLPRLMNGELEV